MVAWHTRVVLFDPGGGYRGERDRREMATKCESDDACHERVWW